MRWKIDQTHLEVIDSKCITENIKSTVEIRKVNHLMRNMATKF